MGPQGMRQVGLKIQKMCKYFHQQVLYGCSVNSYAAQILFSWFCFLLIWVPLSVAMLVCSLPMKSRKSWLMR